MKEKVPFYNIVNMFFVGAIFTLTLFVMLLDKLRNIDLSSPVFGLLKDWNILVTAILLIIMFEIGFIINRASSIIVETVLVKTKIWPREKYDIDVSQISQNNSKFQSMITELNLMRSHILIYLFFTIYAVSVSKYIYTVVFLAFIIIFIFAGKKHNTKINIIRKTYYERYGNVKE